MTIFNAAFILKECFQLGKIFILIEISDGLNQLVVVLGNCKGGCLNRIIESPVVLFILLDVGSK